MEPDTADNYEVGTKGTLRSRFRYSAAAFDIQWHNVQEGALLTPLVLPGAINVGDAYSRGITMDLFPSATEHFSDQLNYTYDQTKLTSYSSLALSGLSVPPPAPGSPLPGTPKSSLALKFAYGQVAVAGGELRFAADAHHQSALMPALSSTIPIVGGYTMAGARASYTRSHWVGTIYATT